MSDAETTWCARYMGWHMVFKAATKREAQAIANRSVDTFGGIVGVDRPDLRKATGDDVNDYLAMGGCLS